MDYDRSDIATTYDAARSIDPACMQSQLQLFLDNVPRERVSRIIDLGCGTGRFTYALAALFEADVVGLDPSLKMLAQSHGKAGGERVGFLRAAGESLPLADEFADPPITQYWDDTKGIGFEFKQRVIPEFNGKVAWDVFVLFDAQATWVDAEEHVLGWGGTVVGRERELLTLLQALAIDSGQEETGE